jgi:DNA-binding SARP family transcriptional activator
MQRALLAILLARRGEVVSEQSLIEELWCGCPPTSAANTLHSLVLRLRRRMTEKGKPVLVRHSPGYVLQISDAQVDAHHFTVATQQAEKAALDGCPSDASELLKKGLSLWRGQAMADVPPTPTVQAEAMRLSEARLAATQQRIDADLLLGSHAGLVGELRALVRDHPLNESLWSQLMRALLLGGRRIEALEAYQEVRGILRDQFGLEPGPELEQLQLQILTSDPNS